MKRSLRIALPIALTLSAGVGLWLWKKSHHRVETEKTVEALFEERKAHANSLLESPLAKLILEKNWIDRHGRLPDPVKHLITIARIKAEAAANNVASVEITGQRLILQKNGSPILLDGSRYPRLTKTKPAEMLNEALEMLRNF